MNIEALWLVLGGAGGLASIFVFGRKAFVKWSQENVQIQSADAVASILAMLREQLEEFKTENNQLRQEICELREEIRKLRERSSHFRETDKSSPISNSFDGY